LKPSQEKTTKKNILKKKIRKIVKRENSKSFIPETEESVNLCSQVNPVLSLLTQQRSQNSSIDIDPLPNNRMDKATTMPPAATATAPDKDEATSNATLQAQAPHSPTNPNSNTDQTISYSAERIIGNGSFGVVFQAAVVETGEIVAIKKVLQDKRFKNRELQIMRQLVKDPHSNIVALKHCFYSQVRCIHIGLRRDLN
jgi:hypothetical protein